MRAGFPDQLDIKHFLNIFKERLDNFEQYSTKDICSQLVRSCGLKWKDFKLGNTKIFFRNSKLNVLTDKLSGDLQIILDCFKKKKCARMKWRIAIITIRLCSILKIRPIQDNRTDLCAASANIQSSGESEILLDLNETCQLELSAPRTSSILEQQIFVAICFVNIQYCINSSSQNDYSS